MAMDTFHGRMDAYRAAHNDSRYEGRSASTWKPFKRQSTEKEARKRWDAGERKQAQLDALRNAEDGTSVTNYPAIFSGFMDKGVPQSEIKPRENVFTFNAWKAKGRSVKKGEHGVRVVTFLEVKDKDTGEVTGKRPWTTVVFHVSQTEPTSEAEARWKARREVVRTHIAAPTVEPRDGDRWIED